MFFNVVHPGKICYTVTVKKLIRRIIMKHEQPRTKKSASFRRKALLTILVMLIALGGFGVWYILQPPKIDAPPVMNEPDDENDSEELDLDAPSISQAGSKERKENFYTFLLVGTNDDYNTDTIMLGSVDTDKDIVNVVSIPRDTMVDVDIKIKKINNAYGRKGIDELRKQVYGVTGVYPDYYCLVNMDQFIEVVDIVDGVDFYVPYNMYHEDANLKYNINLSEGWQHLDGKKAIQLVRFRGTSASDYGRMEVQRDFLKALAKKLVDEFTISQASDIITVISESIDTNMPVKDMIWFYINVARTIDFENAITFDTMPGTTTGRYNGQDYVYLDPQSTLDYINEKINPYTTDIALEELNIIHLQDR